MPIRTQVYCFVLFLAILLTSSLVRSQVGGRDQPEAAPRPAAADPAPFYAAVSQRFQVPAQEVEQLVAQGLPPTQVVVVYFIAQQALRSPHEVVEQRRAGQSWRDIAMASGLGPEQFYYPLPQAARRPFVNVYALFHERPRSQWSWHSLPLRDAEIESLVSLRFVAELDGEEAVRLRRQGLDFVTVQQYLLRGQRTAANPRAAETAVRS